jgi:hypothetical protein
MRYCVEGLRASLYAGACLDSLPGDRDRETSGRDDFRGESAREDAFPSEGGKPAEVKIADSRLDIMTASPEVQAARFKE